MIRKQRSDNSPVLPGFVDSETHFCLDLSGMVLDPEQLTRITEPSGTAGPSAVAAAHAEMQRLEAGAIKNPDENRRVTHFTDRLTYCDSDVFRDVQDFAKKIRTAKVWPNRTPVEAVIINGIGGSALGPQLIQFAVNGPHWNEWDTAARGGYPRIYFVDNTDSAGLADIKNVTNPAHTIVVTVSKSGGTQETLNNMLALRQWFTARKVDFAPHAVAVTMNGSNLDELARKHGWLAVFPMAESIGGRTSETNIVGHVPAALTGIDFKRFVDGAKHMDALTRAPDLTSNPAYQLAVAWYVAGNGRGDRNMVLVPYSDRLVLLGRYLQQLVMESLGKEKDLDGTVVHQGLTVYGNKGGTDAHAYIQQLHDGRNDFFLTIIEILRDAEQIEIADGLSMGDHLHAFKEGLVKALRARNRSVIDVVVEALDEFSLGMLIAMYERAVAFYAELIHINAFHQPGVQDYKLASSEVNRINLELQPWIAAQKGQAWEGTAADVAADAGQDGAEREVEGLLAKFAANGRKFGQVGVTREFRDKKWVFRLE